MTFRDDKRERVGIPLISTIHISKYSDIVSKRFSIGTQSRRVQLPVHLPLVQVVLVPSTQVRVLWISSGEAVLFFRC